METKELIEGNNLIGEFMGMKQGVIVNEVGYYNAEELLYHTSWDWLMPVIAKAKDYLQNIERPSKNHCCKGDMLEVDVQCFMYEINIEKTWQSLIPLVQWCMTHDKNAPLQP